MTADEEERRLDVLKAETKWWEEALPKGWLLIGCYGDHATLHLPTNTSWRIGRAERELLMRFAKIEKSAADLVNKDYRGSHWDQIAELHFALEMNTR